MLLMHKDTTGTHGSTRNVQKQQRGHLSLSQEVFEQYTLCSAFHSISLLHIQMSGMG